MSPGERPPRVIQTMTQDEPVSVRAGTELRCPEPVVFRSGEERPGHLFAVVLSNQLGSPQEPSYVQPGNLIELACWACRKRMNAERERGSEPEIARVLHRFDFAGQLVETLVQYPGEPEIT
jgi:hypothetical protein